jgi:hypothetical protein
MNFCRRRTVPDSSTGQIILVADLPRQSLASVELGSFAQNRGRVRLAPVLMCFTSSPLDSHGCTNHVTPMRRRSDREKVNNN